MDDAKHKFLCVFDLDGTLLNSNQRISDGNIKALKQLQLEGVGIILATGRTELMTRNYINTLGLSLPLISSNGAMITDILNFRNIYSNAFSYDAFVKLIEYFVTKKSDFCIYSDRSVYHSANSQRIDYMHYYNSVCLDDERVELIVLPQSQEEIVKLFFEESQKLAYKIVLSAPENRTDFPTNIDDIEVTFSGYPALEIMPTGSTKGNALIFVANYLGIAIENTFAFGDHLNDISMLENAGYAITPSNAVEEAKNIADYITSSNDEDGVAKAVYEFVFPIVRKRQQSF